MQKIYKISSKSKDWNAYELIVQTEFMAMSALKEWDTISDKEKKEKFERIQEFMKFIYFEKD